MNLALRSAVLLSLRVSRLVETVAFWGAVTLPTVYVPALALWTVLGDLPSSSAVVGTVGLHALLLVVGHRHEARRRADAGLSTRTDTARTAGRGVGGSS